MIFDCLQTQGEHPLPGMTLMLHTPAQSVEAVGARIADYPQDSWILLDAEHPRWHEVDAARGLIASVRKARPDLKIALYPLPGGEFNIRDEDKLKAWRERNDASMIRWSLLGPDLDAIAGECYYAFAPGNLEYERSYSEIVSDELTRLASKASVRPIMLIQPFYRVSRGNPLDCHPVPAESLRERRDIAIERGCDVGYWGGWIPVASYLSAEGMVPIEGQPNNWRATTPEGVETK